MPDRRTLDLYLCRLILLCLIALFVFVPHTHAQTLVEKNEIFFQLPSRIPNAATDEFPFPLGEKLTYEISNFIASIGTLELAFHGTTQYKGQEMIWVTSDSEGLGMSDKEDIFACPESWLPLFVLRDVSKVGMKSKLIESYDQDLCKVVVTSEGEEEPVEVIEKEDKLHNVILLYYIFRMTPLETGQQFNIVTPREDYRVEVGEVEEIEVPYGSYEVRQLTSEPKKFTVWITTGDEPLLVKMKLKSKLGSFIFALSQKEIVEPKVALNTQAKDSSDLH